VADSRVLISGGGTGGHLIPALNLGRALRRADPNVRLLYLGAERGIEASVLPEAGVDYRLLPLQPLYRQRPWRNWRLLAAAPRVLTGLRRTFREFDPHLVLGTGGYVSGPAVLWGTRTGRITAIQEQNAEPGLVTRMLAGRVDQVHLGYPEAEMHLTPGPSTAVFSFGNPVRAPDAEASPGFDWPPGRIALVIGGSQGARGLNERLLGDLEMAATALAAGESGRIKEQDWVAAAGAAPGPSAREGPGEPSSAAPPPRSSWPEDLQLVWVAGPAHAESIAARVAALPWADRIRVVPFIEGLGPQLHHAELAISRAGAMLAAELSMAAVPTIFVPFPAAAGGHQTPNAAAAVAAGAAELREEAKLQPGELWGLAVELLDRPARLAEMREAARGRAHVDAAERIAAELLRALGTRG